MASNNGSQAVDTQPLQKRFYLNMPNHNHPANSGMLVRVDPVRGQNGKSISVTAESGRKYWLVRSARIRSRGQFYDVDHSLRASGLVPGRIWKQKNITGPFGSRGTTHYFIIVANAELATQDVVDGLDRFIQDKAQDIQAEQAVLDSQLDEWDDGEVNDDEMINEAAVVSYEGLNEDPEVH